MGYYLEDILTGERLPATISRLSRKEVMLIHKSKKFHFKWNKEVDFEVYGLRIDTSGEILGIVSIERNASDRAIKIRLIANAKEHTGVGKRLDRIAGSLFAFVCSESSKAGFGGFVYLTPKTQLVNHYRKKYGFQYTGTNMFTDSINSNIIIETYYENSDQEGSEDYQEAF
jgi:hypothetical protein